MVDLYAYIGDRFGAFAKDQAISFGEE